MSTHLNIILLALHLTQNSDQIQFLQFGLRGTFSNPRPYKSPKIPVVFQQNPSL
jgi:hypothetical protein